MPPCTPPRGASRDGARAAARTSRLAGAWVLLLLLVVAAAAVPAHAVDSGDTSPVCADYSCYTMDQVAVTYAAMRDLARSIPGLLDYWGYFTSSNFCAYPGVTCRQSGVTVVASSLQLTGSLPEVADLNAFDCMIVSLDLSKNPGIAGTVPASWSKYPALRLFVMSGTSVRGSLPSEWSVLSQLQAVDLSGTSVDGSLPASWSSMTQLETLLLNGTQVSGTLPESWATMTPLKRLHLSSTSVSGTLPATWSRMTALAELTLSSTLVNGTLPHSWGSMQAVQALAFDGTQISGTLPTTWSSMTQLETLLLNGTGVYGTLPPQWSSMTALKSLFLHSTYVSDTLPTTWSSMQRLETLLLSGTLVSGTFPESWGGLSSLRTLDLSGTSVTGCLPSALVEKNGWTEADVGLTSESSRNCRSTTAPSSTGQPDSSEGQSSNSTPEWVISVVVVSVVVAVGTVVAVVSCCCCRQQGCAREGGNTDCTSVYSRTTGDGSRQSRRGPRKRSDDGGRRVHSCSSRVSSDFASSSDGTAARSSEAAVPAQRAGNAVRGTAAGVERVGGSTHGSLMYDCSSSFFSASQDSTGLDLPDPREAGSMMELASLSAREVGGAVPVRNPLQRQAPSVRAACQARHAEGRAALSRSLSGEFTYMTGSRVQSLINLQNPETADPFFGVFVEDSTYTVLGSDDSAPRSD